MHVLKPRRVDVNIVLKEPVRLKSLTRGREDPLDPSTLEQALESVGQRRNQLKQAKAELDRLERRWKKMTRDD